MSTPVIECHGTWGIIRNFVVGGQRAQQAVDEILAHHEKETAIMARPKTPRGPRTPFGGYKISFAGQAATLEQVVSAEAMPPSAMTKKLWNYVKKHGLSTR